MEFRTRLLEILEDYVTVREWSSAINDDDRYIRMELELDDDQGNVQFALVPVDEGIVSYAVLPDDIPYEQYAAVTEYLHRANYGLLNGCFEFDYEEGYVQFRTFCYCPDEEEPSVYDMDALFSVPLTVLNRYIGGLRQLLREKSDDVLGLISQIEKA